MARFPAREPDIVILAQDMAGGLATHADAFPSPPLNPNDLKQRLNDYLAARDAAATVQARASEAVTHKQECLDALTDAMKAVLHYAEHVASNEQQLALIGWAGRATPNALQLPGQPRTLEASRRGENVIFLDWKEPAEGGKPAAYLVQRREMPDGAWTLIGTAIESEITLLDQPRGKALEYRVLAVNKAGTGPESNTVVVML